MSWARSNRHEPRSLESSTCLQTTTMTTVFQARTTRLCRGKSVPMGACKMALRRVLLVAVVFVMTAAVCRIGLAQSPTYGLGKAPTAEEIRAWDIAISPDGKELPQGRGTAKEGAPLYAQKCAGCHGVNGYGGRAPQLIKIDPAVPPAQGKEAPCLS